MFHFSTRTLIHQFLQIQKGDTMIEFIPKHPDTKIHELRQSMKSPVVHISLLRIVIGIKWMERSNSLPTTRILT